MRYRLLACALVLSGAVPAARAEEPLVEPPSVTSRGGRLAVALTAAPGEHWIGAERFAGMLYQGAYIPPVWRVKPGDVLDVTLENRLAEVTNLHFHGLQVSPRGRGDNVFVHVMPGQSFAYRIRVPRTQDPGLYWFHTHAHGLVSRQIIAGLSGALVVGGIARRFPMLARMRERVLLLKHIPHPQADWQELVTLNGQLAPAIDIRPGEAQLWRIGNIGADLFLKLRLDGARLHLVAVDGHPLQRPAPSDDILLGPGQRAEVVVVGPVAGRYQLRSVPLVMEEGRPPLPEHLLAVLVSSGTPAADVAAAEREVDAARAPTTHALSSLRRRALTARRTIVFTRSMDRTRFFINGRRYGESGTTVTVPLGAVEEWTIRNEDNQLHNFHIHQTAFLYDDRLMDTVTVPSMAGGVPGVVTLKIPFTNPVIAGRFVFHCHVTKHEDKGMMQTIEVVPASAPRASAGAL